MSHLNTAMHLLNYSLHKAIPNSLLVRSGTLGGNGFFSDCLILKNPIEPLQNPLQIESAQSILQKHIYELTTGRYGPIHFVTESEVQTLYQVTRSKSISPFEILTVSKDEAFLLFGNNPFALLQILDTKTESVQIIRSGDFVDFYRGPISNIRQMAEVYEFRDTASHHHHGNVNSLSRVTGIAAKSRPDFIALKTSIQEAEKRNHRKLGRQLKLFYFAEESPGSPFFLPHGTRILRSLINFLKKKNKEFGFEEVISPIIFEKELWKRSGHWDNYKENMFMIQSRNDENTTFGVKPMNCPGHCLIYNSESRSYRDLPMRMAEFSPIHRNEATGALTGLTRVRKFHQDDGHIFCSMKDISKEIGSTLELIDKVYATLGFADYEIVLSTRPETDYMGELSEWEAAEKALTDSLENNGKKWSLNLGDGAFYGPKIDFHISDALGRKHQTATIQLDFQLPARFNLKFQDADDSIQKPVLIHRAILGSVERMLAIILEHYSGRLPFWLSPRQVVVIPVSEKFGSYATRVLDKLKQTDFYVDIDLSDKAFGKKIREAQLLQYNFILIVGEREQDSDTVSVRTIYH